MRLVTPADRGYAMTCPTCGQPLERSLALDLERVVAEASAVDHAVRVRERAAARNESPFVPPRSVLEALRRTA